MLKILEVQNSGEKFPVQVEPDDSDPQAVAMTWARRRTLEWWRDNAPSPLNVIVEGVVIEISVSYDLDATIVPADRSVEVGAKRNRGL
jgi:hypothetical protein